jgi:bifunctional oligoribonuclease and PAP phosphatase NrnA
VRYDAPDWDEVVGVLAGADEIAIACHVNPDGDALGSVLAASLGFRKMGKKTYPSWGATPVEIPFSYAFLPGSDSLVQPHEVPPVEVFLALDCGAADRLGELEATARASKCLINIDHHPGNEEFGSLNVVVTEASSTSELVTRLLEDLGLEFDRDIATCLYTGIVTDTGRFQYTNSSPETLRLAADLLTLGVPATEIAQDVFESAPFGYLKLVGHVLERAILFEEERFVYSWITQKDLIDTGVGLEETEKLIDLVRSTRAAEVAAMFKEQPDGSYRVSLRSKGPTSVGAMARARGGGGHELAAGFTADDIDTTVADLLADLRRART